jgi:hypothetical protein
MTNFFAKEIRFPAVDTIFTEPGSSPLLPVRGKGTVTPSAQESTAQTNY